MLQIISVQKAFEAPFTLEYISDISRGTLPMNLNDTENILFNAENTLSEV
jgi:hypothetical protein